MTPKQLYTWAFSHAVENIDLNFRVEHPDEKKTTELVIDRRMINVDTEKNAIIFLKAKA